MLRHKSPTELSKPCTTWFPRTTVGWLESKNSRTKEILVLDFLLSNHPTVVLGNQVVHGFDNSVGDLCRNILYMSKNNMILSLHEQKKNNSVPGKHNCVLG